MKYKKFIYLLPLIITFIFQTSCFKNQETLDELTIRDIVLGEGVFAENGDTLTVDYQGWLENGTQFDSSIERGVPFIFTLGIGQVIQGWDEGILGMKVGGIRELIIPPHLGYGNQAIYPIPANSILTFEVQLISIRKSLNGNN